QGASDRESYTFEVCNISFNNFTADQQGQQCKRCLKAEVICKADLLHPCKCCWERKMGCSLMPPNLKTSKTDKQTLTEAYIHQFCICQIKECQESKGKGSMPG